MYNYFYLRLIAKYITRRVHGDFHGTRKTIRVTAVRVVLFCIADKTSFQYFPDRIFKFFILKSITHQNGTWACLRSFVPVAVSVPTSTSTHGPPSAAGFRGVPECRVHVLAAIGNYRSTSFPRDMRAGHRCNGASSWRTGWRASGRVSVTSSPGCVLPHRLARPPKIIPDAAPLPLTAGRATF